MAITFQEQRKRQQLLMIAVLGIAAIAAIVLWRGFFATSPQETPGVVISQPPRLSIDFGVFETQGFKNMGTAPEPLRIPQDIGRQNPFIPFAK